LAEIEGVGVGWGGVVYLRDGEKERGEESDE